jgi:hypothetical protein
VDPWARAAFKAEGCNGAAGSPREDRHGVHAFEERPDLADRRCPYNTVCGNGTRTLYGGFTADVPVYVLSSYSSNELNWVVSVQSTGVAGNVWVYSTCFRG